MTKKNRLFYIPLVFLSTLSLLLVGWSHKKQDFNYGSLNATDLFALQASLEISEFQNPVNQLTEDIIISDICPANITQNLSLTENYNFNCGSIRVPEFHEINTNKFLGVGYMLVNQGDAPKPLLVIEQGGPGGSSIILATKYLKLYPELAHNFDILAVEQRGTKWSTPNIVCKVSNEYVFNKEAELNKTEECLKTFTDQVSINSLSSYQISQDIAFLTQQLGYSKFSFMGVSYGALIGQYLLKYNANRLDKTVLDSPAVIGKNWTQSFLNNFENNFSTNIKDFISKPLNAKGQRWRLNYTDTLNYINQIIIRLEKNPFELKLNNTELPIKFDGLKFTQLLITYSTSYYNSTNLLNLMVISDSILKGNTTYKPTLSSYVERLTGNNLSTDILWQSIYCGEGFNQPIDKQEVKVQFLNDFIPSNIYNQIKNEMLLPNLCNLNLEPNNSPLILNTNVSTSNPVLVIGGENDHITLPENLDIISQEFTNSHQILVKDVGHGAYTRSKCAGNSVNQFLTNKEGEFKNLCEE